jgi:hypothetical protein
VATLSPTLSKHLFFYLRKLKVLKALSLCSLLFVGITSSPPTKALPQVLAASSSKDGLCAGSATELTVDAGKDLSSASPVSMDFF